MKCLELFAGGGGAAMGLRQAGFTSVLAVDHAPACIDTLHHHGFPAVHGDLSRPSVRRLIAGQVPTDGLLWASPPCPLFSKAKTRGAPAVDGFPWVEEMLQDARPLGVILENVTGAPWKTWQEKLIAMGYTCEVVPLNFTHIGGPQNRARTFLLGWHGRRRAELLPFRIRPASSLGAAVPWLLHKELAPPDLKWYSPEETYGRARSRPDFLQLPSPTVTCQESKGTRASKQRHWRYNGGPDRASDAAFSAVGLRRLPVEACLDLQGFPPGYRLSGTLEAQYRQCGNAVPPPMAEAIGKRWLSGLD